MKFARPFLLSLLDANKAEISSFLQSYRQQGGSDYEIPRLLFVNWTRLTPPQVDKPDQWLAGFADLEPRSDAICYLAATPEQHPEIIGTATRYALKWSRDAPVAAAEWVNGLPAGDSRDRVRGNLAVQWSSTDPAAADRWLKSLPTPDQSAVRDFLERQAAK